MFQPFCKYYKLAKFTINFSHFVKSNFPRKIHDFLYWSPVLANKNQVLSNKKRALFFAPRKINFFSVFLIEPTRNRFLPPKLIYSEFILFKKKFNIQLSFSI